MDIPPGFEIRPTGRNLPQPCTGAHGANSPPEVATDQTTRAQVQLWRSKTQADAGAPGWLVELSTE